jgi:hypothetical protein
MIVKALDLETQKLTQEYLQSILDYNKETGDFTWKVAKGRNSRVGKIAGSSHNGGYKTIRIDKKLYLEHRLAWLYVYGEFPKQDIDHKNGVRTDNRLDNLRACTRSQNLCNKINKVNSKSKISNVHWNKQNNKWIVNIYYQGKQKRIGTFEDIELAELVAIEARLTYHGEFAKDYR